MDASTWELRAAGFTRRAGLRVVVVPRTPLRTRDEYRRHLVRVRVARRVARVLTVPLFCLLALASGAAIGRLDARQPQPRAWAPAPAQTSIVSASVVPQDWPLALVPAGPAAR